MAIDIGYGGSSDFDAYVYAPTHVGTLNFLQNQITNLGNFSNTLTEAGRSFFSNAKDLFDKFNGAEALRLARLAASKVNNIFKPDVVKSIWELGEAQSAKLVMQRWIMANPDVRKAYHEQRCDGYSDTYIDMFPGDVGHDHYDYRQVMDGMPVDIVDEDGEDNTVTSFYMEDPLEGDAPLALDQRLDILSTWEFVSALMKQGVDDPTSAYGGKL